MDTNSIFSFGNFLFAVAVILFVRRYRMNDHTANDVNILWLMSTGCLFAGGYLQITGETTLPTTDLTVLPTRFHGSEPIEMSPIHMFESSIAFAVLDICFTFVMAQIPKRIRSSPPREVGLHVVTVPFVPRKRKTTPRDTANPYDPPNE